jgi:anti-anti-sigma factor
MPVMDDALAIRISGADRLVVVGISGALDAYTAPRVTEAVYEAMKTATALLVVDTSALTFVDSGGRRALDRACRCANALLVRGPIVVRFDELVARAEARCYRVRTASQRPLSAAGSPYSPIGPRPC